MVSDLANELDRLSISDILDNTEIRSAVSGLLKRLKNAGKLELLGLPRTPVSTGKKRSQVLRGLIEGLAASEEVSEDEYMKIWQAQGLIFDKVRHSTQSRWGTILRGLGRLEKRTYQNTAASRLLRLFLCHQVEADTLGPTLTLKQGQSSRNHAVQKLAQAHQIESRLLSRYLKSAENAGEILERLGPGFILKMGINNS